MIRSIRFAAVTVAALLLPLSLQVRAFAPDDPPGTDTGKRVGTIVKTAIDTALPGVTTLLNAIWGNRKNNDSINKTDLEAKLKEARQKFYSDAQAKLAETALVATQLGVVNQFVDGAVTASQRVNLILG